MRVLSTSKEHRGRLCGRLTIRAAAALVMLSTAAVAAPLEIVQVHIPAEKVPGWFPAGTELRMMPLDKFETLLRAAARETTRNEASPVPRLIRVRHKAHWNSGMLTGRSELVVERSSRPAMLVLDPWTPAISPPDGSRDMIVGALQSGKVVLPLEPSVSQDDKEQTLVLDWMLAARPDTQGRGFSLGLPGDETTTLELELPDGWIPMGPPGYRHGPLPARQEGRRTWFFHGRPTLANLHLLDPGQKSDFRNSARDWVSGTTRIDLRVPRGRDTRFVNWTTDWTIQPDPRGTRELVAELDPDLELIDVVGTEVKQYRSDPMGGGTRVRVALAGLSNPTTRVRFQAHARVPSEGSWSIPAIRPLESAIWTAGSTTVVLDEFHVVRDCQDRAGRRVTPPPAAPGESSVLVFEAQSPHSVANLVFRSPPDQASCDVRGRLYVGRATSRMECQLVDIVPLGSSELDIELPPNWAPDRIQWSGRDEAANWHPALQPDGGQTVRVVLPTESNAGKERTLMLSASWSGAEGRGPLELPRVRPARCTIRDDVWVALVEKELMLQPTSAQGLVWIDPTRVPGLLPPRPFLGPEFQEALAWRWISTAGEARVERERIEKDPRATIQLRARIEENGDRVELTGQVLIQAGNAGLAELPLWLDLPAAEVESWIFTADGEVLARRPMDQAARTRLGLPASGSAWSITLPNPLGSRWTVDFRASRPWDGKGKIPLLSTPERFLPRGTVLIEIPQIMRSRVEVSGLRRIEPALAGRLPSAEIAPSGSAVSSGGVNGRFLVAHALTFTVPGGKLNLITEPLSSSPTGGLVREAYLTTLIHPQGPCLNRIRLLVSVDSMRTLDLIMPPNSSLARVRRDGIDVVPVSEFPRISVPLSAAGPGQRFRTVEIDYESERGHLVNDAILVPSLPSTELPCLAYTWEVLTPPLWQAMDAGPGLQSNDPPASLSWPFGALGLNSLIWPSAREDRRAIRNETLRWMDDRLANLVSGQLSFGELFTRWDSGQWPILIDRTSLSSAGYGPRSICVPQRADASGQSAAMLTLQQYGLAFVPSEGSLLITTQAEAQSLARGTRERVGAPEALLWGSDRSDRLQSVARWRGEPTSREAQSGDLTERARNFPGWLAWRFSGAGWPDSQSSVRLSHEPSRIIPGWLVAILTLLAMARGLATSPRRAVLVPILVMVGSVLAHSWLPERLASLSAGSYSGALVVLVYRLGRQASKRRKTEPGLLPRRNSRDRGRLGAYRLATLFLLCWLAPAQVEARRDVDQPITVLIPFNGSYDPAQPIEHVILRVADYNLLRGLERVEPDAAEPPPIAETATHRISWSAEHEVVVLSDFVISNPRHRPASWSLPVSGCREISATLDGRVTPVFIEPGSRWATIALPSQDRIRLLVRRTASTSRDGDTENLIVPVNPVPSSRLFAESGSNGRRIIGMGARGKVGVDGNDWSAAMGPADRVEIHWVDTKPEVTKPLVASVDSVVLWDIEPAGDRFRARFTYRTSRPLSLIRIAVEPGLIPREMQTPGLVDASWGGTEKQAEWIARIDPPLQDGGVVTLDLWRPVASSAVESLPPKSSAPPGESERSLPRVEPLGVERYSGLLGVRRPGQWTGRLDSPAGSDPLGDETFVKSWGPLPDEALTLSGTSRFTRNESLALITGPTPTRARIRPKVELKVDAGRIDFELEAEIADISGFLDHLVIEIPANLAILGVQCEGLTDWSRIASRSLRLRFDRAIARSTRRLKLRGWIPVPEDPLRVGPRQQRMPTPWPTWPGVECMPGLLVLNPSSALQSAMVRGLSPTTEETTTPTAGGEAVLRRVYRVEDQANPGELRWSTTPPRIHVSVENQITIHPDSAEWVAILRYDVMGGALDAIHLKLPTAWGTKATVQLTGNKHQLTSESRGGDSFWTINPEDPIWGSQRLVIRSAISLTPGQELQFPDLTPLGLGAVDASLGIVYATGAALTTEGSGGLRPISYSSRFKAEEFGGFPGTPTRAYHIDRENWSLKVRIPRSVDATRGTSSDSALVSFADVKITVTPDLSLLGRATFDTEPRTGRFLEVALPAASNVLWSTVDYTPAAPLFSATGTWLIPLGDESGKRVTVIWKGSSSSEAAGPSTLILPRAGTGRVETLATLNLPPDFTVNPSSGGLELATADRHELDRADVIGRNLGAFLLQMDRRSGRDREKLASLLIGHELALRSAERSLQWSARSLERPRRERAGRGLEFVRSARSAIEDEIREAGLEGEVEAPRIYLGLSTLSPGSTFVGVPEPPTQDRIRNLGTPWFLVGSSPGLDEPPASIDCQRQSIGWDQSRQPQQARTILLLGFLGAIALTAILFAGTTKATYTILAGVLGLIALAGGPLFLAAAAVLAAVGWRRARIEAIEPTSAASLVRT